MREKMRRRLGVGIPVGSAHAGMRLTRIVFAVSAEDGGTAPEFRWLAPRTYAHRQCVHRFYRTIPYKYLNSRRS
jgi:hypothetical protein